jgi:hypothetical protein
MSFQGRHEGVGHGKTPVFEIKDERPTSNIERSTSNNRTNVDI